jgi:hypothetical protein
VIETVQDLLEALAALDLDPATPLRIARQPRWPMEHDLARVALVPDAADGPTVYLVEGRQRGYLPEPPTSAQLGWE